MREIKFRGWDEQSREMHYNFQWIDSGKEGNDWIIFRSDRQQLSSKPHPFENPYFRQQHHIMQFTGIVDTKGKDIYEGDIVKLEQWNPQIFQVTFDRGGFCFFDPNNKHGYYHDCKYLEGCVVIGNIYENPPQEIKTEAGHE